jgi:hypothetical protein
MTEQCNYDNYCYTCTTPFNTEMEMVEHTGHELLKYPTVTTPPTLGVKVTENINTRENIG